MEGLSLVMVPRWCGTTAPHRDGDGTHERRAHQPSRACRRHPKLYDGVTIFFTQVFLTASSACMAPGQAFGRYIAWTLASSARSPEYGQGLPGWNFPPRLKRVAELHIESGRCLKTHGGQDGRRDPGPAAGRQPPAEGTSQTGAGQCLFRPHAPFQCPSSLSWFCQRPC